MSDLSHAETVIRDAVAADLNAVRSLYRQLHPDDTTSADEITRAWHTLAESSCARMRLACRNGEVTGTLTLYVLPNLTSNGRPACVLENIVVGCRYRQQGIGAKLLRDAEQISESHACGKIALSPADHRRSAPRFYETHGYARHGISFRRVAGNPDLEESG